jgi:hypothetical protein
MAKRILRVAEWLGITPAIGLCAACGQKFKVPLSALKRTTDAQQDMQAQFDRHVCNIKAGKDAS